MTVVVVVDTTVRRLPIYIDLTEVKSGIPFVTDLQKDIDIV